MYNAKALQRYYTFAGLSSADVQDRRVCEGCLRWADSTTLRHAGAGDGRPTYAEQKVAILRVSIIIACLNAEAVIDRCLESVISQDYPDLEIVVADGGSRDGTRSIVDKQGAGTGRSLILLSGSDRGISDAWNKAVARASGEWLLFLGPDDVLATPDVLSRAALTLRDAAPRYRVVYGQIAMVSMTGEIMAVLDRPWNAKTFRSCRYNLPHQAVFHHRSLFTERGPFDTSYSIVADFDFLLRELMVAEPLYVPNLLVCYKRAGGVSNSGRHAPRGVLEQIRLSRFHVGGVAPVLYWCFFKACIKYGLCLLGGDSLIDRIAGDRASHAACQRMQKGSARAKIGVTQTGSPR